jgi:30S ribosomal protein 3
MSMKNLETNKAFLFKVLWSKSFIGIAVNEQQKENLSIPLTSFYFWPREDGWKLLKAELDSKPWMTETSKTEILNDYTLILNFWSKNLDKNLEIHRLKRHGLNFEMDFLGINVLN